MKRTIGILAGLATLGGVVYLGSQLRAQQTAPYVPAQSAPAAQPMMSAPQTRIAVINLSQVIKGYKKFQSMQNELSSKTGEFKKTYDGYNAALTQKQGEAAKPETVAARREQLGREVKDLQRKIQDLDEEAKNVMSKLQFDRMVQLYRDVEDAVAAHARARNIEMVMHYSDGTGPDKYLPAFFQRRMTNGACMPIYTSPGMDITDAVTQMLNNKFAQAGAVPAVPGR